jgi:hypothetical protein
MRRDTTHVGLEGPILRRRREGLIDGLKLAIEGEEILVTLDERIDEYRLEIQRIRDAAAPGCLRSPEMLYAQYRLQTLTAVRDHIWEGHTYLLTVEDCEFIELLPQAPKSGPGPRSASGAQSIM